MLGPVCQTQWVVAASVVNVSNYVWQKCWWASMLHLCLSQTMLVCLHPDVVVSYISAACQKRRYVRSTALL
jgi:hypothetical protein